MPSSLYKEAPTPEMAELLSAMEAKRLAPKKSKGKKARPKKARAELPPQHNAHVNAGSPYLILRQVAASLAANPMPTPEPPLGPEKWLAGAGTASSMGKGFRPRGKKIAPDPTGA